jgi:glycosidase
MRSRILGLAVIFLSGCSAAPAPLVDGSSPAREAGAEARSPDGQAIVSRCRIRFRHKPTSTPAAVLLAGEWAWSSPDPMSDPDGDGVFEVERTLSPGIHAYRFLERSKAGQESWHLDPANPYRKLHGGVESSGARVPDCARPLLERRSFRLWRASRSVEARVGLVAADDGSALDPVSVRVSLSRELSSRPAAFAISGSAIAITLSSLEAGKHTLRVEASDRAGRAAEPLLLPFWVEDEPFDWRDAVIYMVLIDRFRDGEPGNNAPPAPEAAPSARYQGGDLAGLRAAIEEGYFDDLGVRALWLSPVQTNARRVHVEDGHGITAYHGYWPVRARAVDERLGTADELRAVVAAAHRRGLRVLMDFVINHVHQDHEDVELHPDWFRRGCRCGDPGCDWTERRLECLFARYLPDVNWQHPAGSERFLSDALYWLESFDLDGLRVDAVKHVEDLAIRNLAVRVRERLEVAGQQLYLVGETAMGWGQHKIEDSLKEYETISRYLGEHGLDGQFDFVLFHAVSSSVFAHDQYGMVHLDYWTRMSRDHYPEDAVMSPFLGSHDTSRLISRMTYRGQDPAHPKELVEHKWPEQGLPLAPADDEPYQRAALALCWLLAIPGAPLLYYGDEYGEPGGSDPDNRRLFRLPMARGAREAALFARVRGCARARAGLRALRRGSYAPLDVSEDTLVFARQAGGEVALVALNRAPFPITRSFSLPPDLPISPGTSLRWAIDPAPATAPPQLSTSRTLSLELPPRTVVILTP